MRIVLETPDFIAVDKLAGTLTTPSRHQAEDSRICLGLQLQSLKGIQIFPVHRLDFEVSGLVLFAKNAKAHAKANFWFENHLVQKTYEAWTDGDPEDMSVGTELRWKNKLLRGKRRAYESPHGKESETIAVFKNYGESCLKWELHPLTGRPHQLRVHLAQHGFPILGDELYGSKTPYKPEAIALRAVELDFSKVSDRLGLPEKIRVEGL